MIINKTMQRSDLEQPDAVEMIHNIEEMEKTIVQKGLNVSSWFGTLPREAKKTFSKEDLRELLRLSKTIGGHNLSGEQTRGEHYKPIGVFNEKDHPWFLYWEIYWILKNAPELSAGQKILDAGGASSLFTCYLASLGLEVASIDLSRQLVDNCNNIARAMGWGLHAHVMNMSRLEFPSASFDHAFSICVFEHLDYEEKQAALKEIARCLKPGGTLSITFDYRNPAPYIMKYGMDEKRENQLSSPEDIARCFLAGGYFELVGNQSFCESEVNYLENTKFKKPYTFGALFLRKKG